MKNITNWRANKIKTLVVYYSFTGNSKEIAEYVKDKLNADIIELEPKIPFSDDYDAKM